MAGDNNEPERIGAVFLFSSAGRHGAPPNHGLSLTMPACCPRNGDARLYVSARQATPLLAAFVTPRVSIP